VSYRLKQDKLELFCGKEIYCHLPEPKSILGEGGTALSMVDLQKRNIGFVSVPAE
jgi:hypothetical protein